MKEQLKEALTKAIELAEKTGEFVISETPEVIRQFLLYETIACIVLMIFAFLMSFVAYKLGRHLDDEDDEVTLVLTVVSMIVTVPMFMINLLALIQLLVAPKLYLIKHLIDAI